MYSVPLPKKINKTLCFSPIILKKFNYNLQKYTYSIKLKKKKVQDIAGKTSKAGDNTAHDRSFPWQLGSIKFAFSFLLITLSL